jgi:hypothetical protein
MRLMNSEFVALKASLWRYLSWGNSGSTVLCWLRC